MKAIFTKTQQDGYDSIIKNRKEKHFAKQLTAIYLPTQESIITLCLYHTASRVYACVWIKDNGEGGGSAGGYGYCKASAAAQKAFDAAGVSFSENIAGVGIEQVKRAMSAIMQAKGLNETDFFIHEARG